MSRARAGRLWARRLKVWSSLQHSERLLFQRLQLHRPADEGADAGPDDEGADTVAVGADEGANAGAHKAADDQLTHGIANAPRPDRRFATTLAAGGKASLTRPARVS